jgi:hypothetical protein
LPKSPYLSPVGNPEKWPRRLYKFQTADCAAALRQRGSIRVGTLHDFRNSEKHGHGVVDEGEGTLRFNEQIEGTSRRDQLSQYSHSLFAALPPNTRISNLTITTPVSIPDLFIYCTSLEPVWDANIAPEYTACVEIFDVPKFIVGIAKVLARKNLITDFLEAGTVAYEGRDHTVRNVEG